MTTDEYEQVEKFKQYHIGGKKVAGFKTDPTSGLITHYVGTILTSFAGTDAQYMDGNVVRLTWETSVDDIKQEYDGVIPESITRNVTLGDGWDVDENTGLLFHESDEDRESKGLELKDFKQSSAYGQIIALIVGERDDYVGNYEVNDGGGELEVDLAPILKYFKSQGFDDPRDPKIWEGLQLEFRGILVKQRGNEYNRVVPVRLVSTPKDKSTKPAKSEVSPDVWFDFVSHGATPDQADTLNDILNQSPNQSSFVTKALAVNGVKENDTLMAILVSDSGPWTEREQA